MKNSFIARLKNDPNDFYETPIEATEALLLNETFKGQILEPACGNGAISEVLKEHNYDVKSSDLHRYRYNEGLVQDFLTYKGRATNIITNPPFLYAEEFVRKANEICDGKVAMLLRLQFLESKKRYNLFKVYRPSRVYVFSRRISCNTKNHILAFAWFIWDKSDKSNETKLNWIK